MSGIVRLESLTPAQRRLIEALLRAGKSTGKPSVMPPRPVRSAA